MHFVSWLSGIRGVLAAGLITLSGLAAAAQLDLSPDAVLGKPNFTTAGAAAASATNLGAVGQVAEDPLTGALWVTDEISHRVLRFSSAAAFANGEAANLVLGQANFTASAPNRGGAPAANTLTNPTGVAVDQAGRVYVAEYGNSRVLVFKPPFSNGMNASEVIGQADFTSASVNRGATPAANTLSRPVGIALDSRGNLFVADRGNNRVLRFAGPATTGALATAVFGQGGSFTTNTVSTTATGLNNPNSIAIDASDNLWVADWVNHRVVRFNGGAAAGDATADLVLCQSDFVTALAATTQSGCDSPAAVAVDSLGAVYVADTRNNRVLRFTTISNGAAASAVAGQANYTTGTANRGGAVGQDTLYSPFQITLDRTGNLLVSDNFNNRLLRYDLPRARAVATITSLSPASMPQGGTTFVLTVNGTNFSGDSVVNWNGSPRSTQFLSDRRLLAQVSAADIAGAGPYAVTVSTPAPGGGTSTLLNFTTYTRTALDGAADRVLGQPDFTSNTAHNPNVGEEQVGMANAATLMTSGILGITVDRNSGRLFVADITSGRVQSWPSVSTFYNGQPADIVLGKPDEFTVGCSAIITAASMCGPFGVATDSAGSLYVSDSLANRVLRFDPPFATGMAASAVFGQGGSFTTNTPNNGGISANSLGTPRGLAVSDSALFVHDAGNNRILVYNNPRGDFTADAAIGQDNLTTNGAQPPSSTRTAAQVGTLAVGPDGGLYYAAFNERRILRFPAPFTTNMAADLVIGQPDFSSTTAAVTASGLAGPVGIAFDPAGNLFVADYTANRILRYAAPLASTMAATGVLGQADFTTFTTGVSTTKFAPSAIAMDRVGNLVVGDYSNSRILAFDRPFAFTLDPAQDLDGDGIPNGVEVTQGRDPYTKDNDLFSPGLGSATLFSMQQYRDFLAREGDASGINFWANSIVAGTYSRPQVIEAFLNSAEFGGVIAPVVRLYYATFLRVPDYAGLTYNAGLIRAGTVSLQQLADFFVASPEFAATYGALNNTQFVTLLYQNVLGRAPDQAGLDGWVAILNGGASRGSVLIGFSESPEYKANMANEVLVTMMYAGMLRRTPETAGYNGWLAALDSGTYTAVQMIDGFYQSVEYHNRFLP